MNFPVEAIKHQLMQTPRRWLITGVAGFIGSNLLECLLKLNQSVVGLDNFSTGFQANLDSVRREVQPHQWQAFKLIEGDIRDLSACQMACDSIDFVLHQAALGSVPRSIKDPLTSHAVNVDGFLNMLIAAQSAKVNSFTYASSSSVYGDNIRLPKQEDTIGNPLSPYALTKRMNEMQAEVFAKTYDFKAIGLRYFNVFGPRQDPNGAYAAVIPKWISAMLHEEPVNIHGDGETSRDFCFIENVIQANLLAALAAVEYKNQIYNIAYQDRTTLSELYTCINAALREVCGIAYTHAPSYGPERAGDVKHSHADITKARINLGYAPQFSLSDGIKQAVPWYQQANTGVVYE